MVFEKIGRFFGKKDALSTRGLEEFTIPEQERILNRISSKEAELRESRAEALAERRIRELERRLGVKEPTSRSGKSKLQSFKEHRQRNLIRRAARQKQFEDNEKAFREGKLAVKPVGVQNSIKRLTPQEAVANKGKLIIKPIKLKAPGSGFR